ncbi:hypothetical protein PPYR_10242 [Photinus pyralis]|uniref:Uncharacterized protein n=1 Tax=Photinus pyralis TaxID=7054 RepID=A0A5N4AFU1_PHOPY|nr:hypothetical protein PPYR_10242 [Photinus pyralis]
MNFRNIQKKERQICSSNQLQFKFNPYHFVSTLLSRYLFFGEKFILTILTCPYVLHQSLGLRTRTTHAISDMFGIDSFKIERATAEISKKSLHEQRNFSFTTFFFIFIWNLNQFNCKLSPY